MSRILILLFAVFIQSYSLASEPEGYRLYILDCGRIENRSVFLHSGDLKDLFRSQTKINTCFLFKKGDIELLWDVGIPDYVFQHPNGVSQKFHLFNFSVKRPLVQSLEELGVDPNEVEYVALSHMHFDHAGNLELFKNATILVQPEEYQAAFSKESSKYHFDPKLYDQIPQNHFQMVPSKFDVFGDGKLIMRRAPGHTPGHQILSFSLKELGNVVLSGDLYSSVEHRQEQNVPLFNADKTLTKNTMQWFERLVAESKAQVWIQHDLSLFSRLKMAPQYYELR